MRFVTTFELLNALKARLAAMPLPDGAPGEKLFERVDFHMNKKLREVLKDLTIIKERVAIIVPAQESYENQRQGRTVLSSRTSGFDLLLADRAWTKGGHDAFFGGEKNVGVIAMKELVVEELAINCQLGLPYVCLQPQEGAEIEISDDEVKDVPGRQCYVLNYLTPAGVRRLEPTTAYAE